MIATPIGVSTDPTDVIQVVTLDLPPPGCERFTVIAMGCPLGVFTGTLADGCIVGTGELVAGGLADGSADGDAGLDPEELSDGCTVGDAGFALAVAGGGTDG
ncbi:hypothetical protein [Streptomyces sp. GS7]|uniref:hypothetical protein n=1 Tax=Streptomyces sp. GS7 TaxID=2692234 RepID=UPI001317A77A|nr:hypothetical protein [Streptomyces sp. GS7]QHC22854.1 hypothetical protein GR130_16855 [Streptomyces sp. GS7]